jgi:hypothetical protein
MESRLQQVKSLFIDSVIFHILWTETARQKRILSKNKRSVTKCRMTCKKFLEGGQ